jgi:hypothetical protein
VNQVWFELEVPGTTEEPPAGFLFLCPPKNFKTGPSSFRWPDCPAYWSFDPSGVDRLTLKEAIQLGFPAFQLKTTPYGPSWNASVYEGLRKFHRAKGFNPDTQDLAWHLGHPLFELLAEADSTFAHGKPAIQPKTSPLTQTSLQVDEGDCEVIEEEQPQAAEDKHESDDPQTGASISEDIG